MKKREKLSILAILIIIVAILITKQFLLLRKEIKTIKHPTIENRQLGNMSVYKWITVKDLAVRHNVREEDIFKTLEIKPEKGDENMPIRELLKKYNKDPQQIKNNLRKIIKTHRNIEGKSYE